MAQHAGQCNCSPITAQGCHLQQGVERRGLDATPRDRSTEEADAYPLNSKQIQRLGGVRAAAGDVPLAEEQAQLGAAEGDAVSRDQGQGAHLWLNTAACKRVQPQPNSSTKLPSAARTGTAGPRLDPRERSTDEADAYPLNSR
ncbi:hypothetical protein NDU88_002219 [Pleurodeles waltl]|uniref:Uncharacterized protein n=1 Tax=Pleurodeles waltl TaxID=8319 RepID=A0AAV7Q632_PLEWA|nr:hypothetical protein NDU88_002219 [Pleurodeles waltl]